MNWPNINVKILTKQHQNINRITKEMKYCFTYFIKWPKRALWWRWSRRKRTQPCGNHLSNRQGSHVGQFTDFGDHYHLLSRKNWVSSLSNMEKMRVKSCNLQNNLVAMKRKALPPKIMSLMWVIAGKVKKKADVSGQSDRGLADDALTSLLRSRARPPPY